MDKNTGVIVFSFSADNSDGLTFPSILEKAQALFADIPGVKVHLAIKDSAKEIISILTPEV